MSSTSLYFLTKKFFQSYFDRLDNTYTGFTRSNGYSIFNFFACHFRADVVSLSSLATPCHSHLFQSRGFPDLWAKDVKLLGLQTGQTSFPFIVSSE